MSLKLKNLTAGNVQRGFVLTSLVDPMHCVDQFSAQLMVLDLLPPKSIMTAGYSCVFHAHTAIEDCQIKKLLGNIDKRGKPVKGPRPGFAKSNQGIICRIRLSRKVCLHTFEQMRQLGRFTLRDEGKTIAMEDSEVGQIKALRMFILERELFRGFLFAQVCSGD